MADAARASGAQAKTTAAITAKSSELFDRITLNDPPRSGRLSSQRSPIGLDAVPVILSFDYAISRDLAAVILLAMWADFGVTSGVLGSEIPSSKMVG